MYREYSAEPVEGQKEEQYQAMCQLAQETGKPLSVLIREAIREVHLASADRQRRRAALQSLLSLDAPVADWEQMEREIIAGALT